MKAKKFAFFLALALILVLVIPLIGCKPTIPEKEIQIRIGSPFKAGSILVDAAEKFKEIAERESGGKIKVEILAGIDSEEVVNEKNSKGQLEMQSNGHRALEIYASQYFFFNAPYVMKDLDHFMRVWEGSLGKKAAELVAKNGNVQYLGIIYRGLRQTTSKKLIKTPSDVAGLKLRLPVVPTWVAVWKEMGADPVPIPLTDLYNSLKTGTAQASEGDLTQISSFKLYEVQTYLTMTNHLVQTGGMMINKPFFDKLSKEAQQLILKASKESCDWATLKLKNGEAQIIDELKKNGMQVVIPDAEAFRVKGKPAVEKLFKSDWPVTTWAEVLAQ
jgi:tripartite ATP-independent transporter DctP family solute receptor